MLLRKASRRFFFASFLPSGKMPIAAFFFLALVSFSREARADEPESSIILDTSWQFDTAQFTCEIRPTSSAKCSGEEYQLQQIELQVCLDTVISNFFTKGIGNNLKLKKSNLLYQTGGHGCEDSYWSDKYHYQTKTLFFRKSRSNF